MIKLLKYECKGKSRREQKHAFYWQGYKHCSKCAVWINNYSNNNKYYCCHAPFKTKPNRPNNTKGVGLIQVNRDYLRLGDHNKIVNKKQLNEISFYRKVYGIIENTANSIKVDSELFFILVNYFTGKKYRLARPLGRGNETIQFIKQQSKEDLK